MICIGTIVDQEILDEYYDEICQHKKEILEFFQNVITNAFVESINSKIQCFSISNYNSCDSNFFSSP